MVAARAATSAAGVVWNLADLYAGLDDPALAEHGRRAEREAARFAEAHRARVGALGAEALARALDELERITTLALRPFEYAQLVFAADTAQPRHGALLQAAQQRHSAVRRRLLFFELEWVALPEARAAALLADPALARHRHFLELLPVKKPHLLSEPEERVLELMSNTGRHAFGRLFEEVVSALRCRLPEGDAQRPGPGGGPGDHLGNGLNRGAGEITVQQALAALHRPERETRRRAAEAITEALHDQQRVLTFILNTLVQEHADVDRLRAMPDPMHARNLENEIARESVEALLAACEAKMGMVARYYALKRRLLGLERLYDYDRYAPVTAERASCTFAEAREIVLEAYRAFSPDLAGIASLFFERRWIDAEPRPGKAGGAFSSATVPEAHPYILMNYSDTLRDVMTLAHELGHGIHQYLARPRGWFQFQAPLTTSETASTFGEMLVFRSLMARHADPRVRLGLVCGKLEDSFATIFRQAVMTRFEQGLHRARREQGELDAETIGARWMEANRAMFGDSLELSAGYGCWWSYIPHFIRTPFYVYAYSFGELLAIALLRRYDAEGAAFVPKYLALLAAGGSEPPPVLLGRIGLDINDPAFWRQGLAVLEELVGEAESLAAQAGPG